MGKHVGKYITSIVIVIIGVIVRRQYSNDVKDFIHNSVVNNAMGTEGVDYANHLNPDKYEFRYNENYELVNTGIKKQPGKPSSTKSDVVANTPDEGEYEIEMIDVSSQQSRSSGVQSNRRRSNNKRSGSGSQQIKSSPFRQSKWRNGNRKSWTGNASDAKTSPFERR